ncbi:MAG: NTP transferase domain-containing protein [Rhodovibrionaceae bacterium]
MPAGGGYTALVLAGSRGPEDPVALASGVAEKCLAPLHGKPMLSWVLETLQASASVTGIAVTASRPELVTALCGASGAKVLRAARSPAQSVLEAAESLDSAFPLLVVTADNPLLTPARIDAFCTAAANSGAEIAAGLVPSAAIKAAFPESRRTYLRFRDERYCGANLFALRSESALAGVAFWRKVEQQRKRPWRIVQAFGAGSLLAFALNRLTLEQAFARASGTLGVTAAAIPLVEAEAAVDVDRPEDLALAERLLRARE